MPAIQQTFVQPEIEESSETCNGSGKFDYLKNDRLIRFFNTPDHALVKEFQVLRERSEFRSEADQ